MASAEAAPAPWSGSIAVTLSPLVQHRLAGWWAGSLNESRITARVRQNGNGLDQIRRCAVDAHRPGRHLEIAVHQVGILQDAALFKVRIVLHLFGVEHGAGRDATTRQIASPLAWCAAASTG